MLPLSSYAKSSVVAPSMGGPKMGMLKEALFVKGLLMVALAPIKGEGYTDST